jgi:hypothetical protein
MSKENKGREFWIERNPIAPGVHAATMDRQPANSQIIHAIEIAAFDKCQAEKEVLKKQLAMLTRENKELRQDNDFLDDVRKQLAVAIDGINKHLKRFIRPDVIAPELIETLKQIEELSK